MCVNQMYMLLFQRHRQNFHDNYISCPKLTLWQSNIITTTNLASEYGSLGQQFLHYSTVLSSIWQIMYVFTMFKRRKNTQLALYETAKHEAIKKLQSTKPLNDSADKQTIVQMNVTARFFYNGFTFTNPQGFSTFKSNISKYRTLLGTAVFIF